MTTSSSSPTSQSSEPLRVAIIGTGRPHRSEGATGMGMSHQHARGYKAAGDQIRFVAFCDIVAENAAAFRDLHGDGSETLYTDYHEMLQAERPDIVSICTWPALHAPMVIACAEAGVRAIHCEKPMATTWGDCRRMVEACDKSGSQLTFNHQRRFNEPFRKAREILRSGAIGELTEIQCVTGNLYDWGTHWFDMTFFLNDETPAEWVIGQIDLRGNKPIFGAPIEGQGIASWKCANGVRGRMTTGFDAPSGPQIRLVGTQGFIDLEPGKLLAGEGAPVLCVLGKEKAGWQSVEVADTIHGDKAHICVILDLIDAIKTGREPETSGHRALRATELIFGTYESSRRRGRVDLPLEDIDDSPLQSLLDAYAAQAGDKAL